MSNSSSQEPGSPEAVLNELNALARRVAPLSSDMRTELECFSSGSAMLDVHRGDRLFVLAYSPGDGFGVDEFEDDVAGLGTSFRHHFDDLAHAREKLLALVATAG